MIESSDSNSQPQKFQSRNGFYSPAALIFGLVLLLISFSPRPGQTAGAGIPVIEAPSIIITGTPFQVQLSLPDGGTGAYTFQIVKDGQTVYTHTGQLPASIDDIQVDSRGQHTFTVRVDDQTAQKQVRSLPGILTLLPPLVAILVALIFRQVIIALFMGVWIGSFFVTDFQFVRSFFYVVDHYTVESLAGEGGSDHIAIVIFTLLLGGMVGVFSRMGGTQGIVNKISKIATSPRRGQLSTWLMGIAIFFDDYTNTLIVGNTMRPLTDKLRISREKLSYIVDSTAAPVAVIGIITSWIGFEISLIKDSFETLNIDRNPFTTFIASIQYSYYPILTLIFGLLIATLKRDYGPMLKAERRARRKGELQSQKAIPISNIDKDITSAPDITPRWFNAAIPVAVVVLGTIAGLIVTGRSSLLESGQTSWTLMDTFRASNSFTALLWSSLGGCLAAAILAVSQRLLSVTETVNAWVAGVKSMIMAFIILVLAWNIGSVCDDLHTASYLVNKVSGVLSPQMLPTLIFLIAALVSFATGTSWATMTILTPICIPLVFQITSQTAMTGESAEAVLLSSIAAIMAGSVFGDHCSPISDTTIMSSMACAADHIDHVRTQIPYALTVALVAILLGYLPAAFQIPSVFVLLLCGVAIVGIVLVFGKPNETDEILQ